jgi:hypothetical protein
MNTAAAFSPSPSFLVNNNNVNVNFNNKNINSKTPLILSHNHKQVRNNQILRLESSQDENNNKNSIDVMMGKVDIPDEYKEEIFRIEGNTPAAKDRKTRTTIYGSVALLGIFLSSFNAFLTNIRDSGGAGSPTDLTAINELGFGWVGSNPLTSFFLLNKIGGGLALLLAGLGGTLVELEQRTKNENAEKIWTELQKRKSQGESGKKKKKKQKNQKVSNKKMNRKNRKRLDALSEVIAEESKEGKDVDQTVVTPAAAASSSGASEPKESSDDNDGIFGKVKNFYEKADSMAQSQALLLNKELEDRGVVDKITDETGLKVIGKEEAEKLQKKNQNESDNI